MMCDAGGMGESIKHLCNNKDCMFILKNKESLRYCQYEANKIGKREKSIEMVVASCFHLVYPSNKAIDTTAHIYD